MKGVEEGILLTVWTLVDKGLIQREDLPGLASKVEYTADSIAQGRISFDDLRIALRDEYDVEVRA